MVNRIWHHLFGNGIVATTSDFGSAGAPPSHAELLEWLAAEFAEPTGDVARPWSVKSMIRLIVLSETFRQSSRPTADGMSPRRRFDVALAVSSQACGGGGHS